MLQANALNYNQSQIYKTNLAFLIGEQDSPDTEQDARAFLQQLSDIKRAYAEALSIKDTAARTDRLCALRVECATFKKQLQARAKDYAERKDELAGEWDMATRRTQSGNKRLFLNSFFLTVSVVVAGATCVVLPKKYSLPVLGFTMCALLTTAAIALTKYGKVQKTCATSSTLAGQRLSAVEKKHDYAERKLYMLAQATDSIIRTALIHSQNIPQLQPSRGTGPVLVCSKTARQP